jgi:hypothetical protein
MSVYNKHGSEPYPYSVHEIFADTVVCKHIGLRASLGMYCPEGNCENPPNILDFTKYFQVMLSKILTYCI